MNQKELIWKIEKYFVLRKVLTREMYEYLKEIQKRQEISPNEKMGECEVCGKEIEKEYCICKSCFVDKFEGE